MPTPSAIDITVSVDANAGEVTFSASTSKAEDWMGSPEETVPLAEAKAYRERAEAAGLTVASFP
jgi:hypothetical protein